MKSLYRKAVIGSVITSTLICNTSIGNCVESVNLMDHKADIVLRPGEFNMKSGKRQYVDKDFNIDNIPLRHDDKGYFISEYDCNLVVAEAVRDYLISKNIDVKMIVSQNKSDDLNVAGRVAKSYSPKIYLSIHHNYIDNPNVEGYLMMYNEEDKLSEYYAKELSNALTDSPMLTKQRQDIVNTGNIGELNESPANVNILAELEFFSNKEAIKKAMTDEQIEFLAETIGSQMIKTLNEVK